MLVSSTQSTGNLQTSGGGANGLALLRACLPPSPRSTPESGSMCCLLTMGDPHYGAPILSHKTCLRMHSFIFEAMLDIDAMAAFRLYSAVSYGHSLPQALASPARHFT